MPRLNNYRVIRSIAFGMSWEGLECACRGDEFNIAQWIETAIAISWSSVTPVGSHARTERTSLQTSARLL